MVESAPNDFSRSSVGPLARFLLISAREDPSLLRRATPAKFASGFTRLAPLTRREPFWRESAPIRESDLEDLVSIAINSARQADDASRQARASVAKSRRGAYAFAALGILGGTVAAADLTGKSILIAAGIVSVKTEGESSTAATAAMPIQFVRLLPTEGPFGQPPAANATTVDARYAADEDQMAPSEPNDMPVVEAGASAPRRETIASAPMAPNLEMAGRSPLLSPQARRAVAHRPYVVQYARYQPEPPLWRLYQRA
jgi:hypothetical protein